MRVRAFAIPCRHQGLVSQLLPDLIHDPRSFASRQVLEVLLDDRIELDLVGQRSVKP